MRYLNYGDGSGLESLPSLTEMNVALRRTLLTRLSAPIRFLEMLPPALLSPMRRIPVCEGDRYAIYRAFGGPEQATQELRTLAGLDAIRSLVRAPSPHGAAPPSLVL